MRKTILHLLNTGTYSGAENVAVSIINNTDKTLYKHVYVSLDGKIKETLEENNIDFSPIKRMSFIEVRKKINELNPDVIHSHDFTASVICSAVSLKIPVISHIHNNAPWLKQVGPLSLAFLLSSFKINKIMGVSPSILNEYIFSKFIKNKFINIKNPIDKFKILRKANEYSAEKSETEKKYDLIFVGRLSVEKDPIQFIKVVSSLIKEFPDIKVAIVGDGNLKAACIELISNLNLLSNINLIGFSKNPYELIKNSKILCITSKWEGYGLVAAEAIILGKPVVATAVGGLPTIIDSGCGFLSNDEFEYISELKKLLSDSKYYNYKKDNAIKKSNSLGNLDSYMENIEKIYSEVIYG